ncbi:MAG: SRPBCC family protein [Wenzhouxiangellaceae bacterium]|nr:SRPBCC family protein [Wenzhouxiangellaceae bacterium]
MACFNSTVINAPVDQVWKTLRDFHNLDWGTSIVERCEPQGKAHPAEPGAGRRLNDAIAETLVALDDLERRLAYRIEDDSALPDGLRLNGCISEVRAIPVTGDNTTVVTWSSRWDSAQGDAQGFLDTVYKALLADLRNHCERNPA